LNEEAQRDRRFGLVTLVLHALASRSSGEWNDANQLLKVAIGLAFGAYFVWWSLQVLDRLTPEYDVPTAVVARAS
jgi:hypothetical protein